MAREDVGCLGGSPCRGGIDCGKQVCKQRQRCHSRHEHNVAPYASEVDNEASLDLNPLERIWLRSR